MLLAKWPYPRHVTIAIASGVAALLIICIILLFNTLHSSHPPIKKTVAIVSTSTATVAPTNTIAAATATTEPTATPLPPHPTATPIPHPLPVPQNAPPPSHNIVILPPTPTPVSPTATPSQPTATPTQCASTAPCPTPIPPTPTATPGACQAGGAPYYTTPVATPTRDVIQGAITDAANANGIPPALLEAIAWQESGWQINVVACDGGIGLMQVMPSTATWLNQYYGTSNDPYSLNGSAHLGAGYLAYFYHYYTNYVQQNNPNYCPSSGCNWDTPWPNTTDNSTIRDIIISVYNEGAGTMGKYGIINWNYVSSVLNFYHNRYGGQGS